MHAKRIVLAAALLAAASLVAAQSPSPQAPAQQAPPQGQAPQGQRPPMRSPIPDTFTNLQVLPKDITKPELVNIMKSLAITFEKRCSFCHVATDDLSQADFSSDDKETKKKAREMLRFIRAVQSKSATTTAP
jgi:hypothetical protein